MQHDKTALIDSINSLYRLYLDAARLPAEFYPHRLQGTLEEYKEKGPERRQAAAVYRKTWIAVERAREELLRVAHRNGFFVPDSWLTVRFYGTYPRQVQFFRADGKTVILDAVGKPRREQPGEPMIEWVDTGPDFPALAIVKQEMKVAIMRLAAEKRGQGDKKRDKKKLSTRGLTTEARACIRLYKTKRRTDPKITMKAVITEYLTDHTGRFSSIMKSISAHPEEWKVDAKRDNAGDKTI